VPKLVSKYILFGTVKQYFIWLITNGCKEYCPHEAVTHLMFRRHFVSFHMPY